jgi:hypothetical protein
MIRFRGSDLRAPTLQLRGERQRLGYALGLLGRKIIGMWRSLVARTAGGREAASSNLVIPTKYELFLC